MCYHRYTSHPCGHTSRSIGKCSVDILATAVPFCDKYHVIKDQVLEPCGGSYCKEDKDTAHWVENGQALLTACDDDLAIFKERIVSLYPKLQALETYREAFGGLQPTDMERARSMHEEYVDVRETFLQTKNRRQLILDGIQKAREKQQAIHVEKMHRVQQYVNKQKLQSVQPTSPQSVARVNQTSAKRSIKRASSGVWESGDTFATPSRPIDGQILRSVQPASPQSIARVNQTSAKRSIKRTSSGTRDTRDNSATPSRPAVKLVSPVKLKRDQSSFYIPTVHGSPNLASPFSVTYPKAPTVDPNPSPPKKRRGRPPKVKVEDALSQPRPISQTNNDDSPITDVTPERRTIKRSNKKEPPTQALTTSGVRRSGRVKQRVSYAESPTSSPERPDQSEPVLESASINQPKRLSRLSKITSSKKTSRPDELYATDEEDGTEAVGDDDEWQRDEGNDRDTMDIVPTPAQKSRSKKKRTATSPPMNAPVLKRQATVVHRDVLDHYFGNYNGLASPDRRSHYQVSGDKSAYMGTTTTQSANSRDFYSMPSTPSKNMGIGNMSKLLYHTNPIEDGVVLDPKNLQDHELNPEDLSPLRRSDWLNGLTGPNMALSLDDIDDPNTYDFDVSAMSRAVADFDAQQG